MKYIRTKDGHILEVGKTTDYGFVVMPECNKAVRFVDSGNEFVDVIKQADTIEELLDRIVLHRYGLIRVDKNFTIYRFEDNEVWYDITYTELKVGIYGAIWTDKGLIYVAKLNDKGEWELL